MEISVVSVVLSIIGITTLTWTWKVLNWLWFKPKSLERCLRQQGLAGNPYRLFFGDMLDFGKMMKEARSHAIAFSNDIAPRVVPLLCQTINNYGKNSFTWNGPTPIVNIMEPLLVREILSKTDVFHKPETNPQTKLLLNGLLCCEGQQWVNRRKIINPAFHIEKLKLLLPAFYVSCNDMVREWEMLVSEKGYCELDAYIYLDKMIGDVISRAAFGSSYEDGKMIFQLQKEQINLTFQILESFYIPGWRFLPTKINRRMVKIANEIRALLLKIINKREKIMKEGGDVGKDDLLGVMLNSNLKEIQESGNKKGVGLSRDDVIDECKLFYLGGKDTTLGFLSWTLILLAKHPNWQQLAREEVFQVFGKNTPDFDGLNRLKIVTMILNEVLRLYPPGASLPRKTQKTTKLGEIILPAGVELSLPTILIHRDPEIWGQDALDFKPDRFSDGVTKATKNGQPAFFPFSLGPRICIGHNFAMMEAKVALAMILQCFSFELSASYLHAPFAMLTLHPQHGVPIILKKL